jgi:hypothetical protein
MPIVIVVPGQVDPGTPQPDGTTRNDIVEEVLSNVQGFTSSPDQITSLSADLSDTATSLKVDSAAGIANGMIEIGNELLWVTQFDQTSGDVRLLPKGRGFRGTKAEAHPAGETVVISPTVPRSAIIRELNNQLRSLFPRLFGVAQETFTFTDIHKAGWPIPAAAEMVLDVRYQDIRSNWQRVRQWEVENTPGTAPVVRFSGVPIAQPVQVVYGIRPGTLDADDALLASTGLSSSIKDLLIPGVLSRLLPMIDVARLGVQHAVADELAQARQLGTAATLANEFKKTFNERLEQEVNALQRRYPARVHFTR